MKKRSLTLAVIGGLALVIVLFWPLLGEEGKRSAEIGEVPFLTSDSASGLESGETNDVAPESERHSVASDQVVQQDSDLLPQLRLEVRTVDERGESVSGVSLVVGSANCRLGQTLSGNDGRTELMLDPRSLGDDALYCWSVDPRYVGRSNRLTFEETRNETAIVTVSQRSMISGAVRLPNGELAGEGVSVIAYDSRIAFVPGSSGAGVDSNPAFATALTDADGAFVLEGLSRASSYTIEAGGAGMMTQKAVRNVTAGTTDLKVVVYWGYVLHTRLVEFSGAPISVSTSQPRQPHVSFDHSSAASEKLHRVVGMPHSALLAGANHAEYEGRSKASLFQLFVSPVRAETLGPIICTFSFPGYASVVGLPLWAESLNSLSEGVNVVLSREASDFGDLNLSFAGTVIPWTIPKHGYGRLWLVLRGTVETISLKIDGEHLENGITISNIPYGAYQLSIDGVLGKIPGLELPLEIDVQSPSTRVELDFGQASGIELELWRLSGQRHEGYARVTTVLLEGRPDGGGPSSFFDLAEEPYLAYPLSPGRYWVYLSHPFGGLGRLEVELEPGRIATVIIHEQDEN